MMQYITIKRYKRDDAGGRFNIPYGTDIESHDGMLWHQDHFICADHSAVMREYFARNDDGNGLWRGKLSHAIIDELHMRDGETLDEWNKRWEPVWNDKICRKYKKDVDSTTTFLWSIDFYNAPILDLLYIAGLVGAKTEA